jgi:hypothetical protein
MDKEHGASVTNFYWDIDDFKIVDEIPSNSNNYIHSHYTSGNGKVVMDRPIWKKRSKLRRFLDKLLRKHSSEPALTTIIEYGTKSSSQTISTSFDKK